MTFLKRLYLWYGPGYDLPEQLHPLCEHLPRDEREGEEVLDESEEDLEHLLLQQAGRLGGVGQQEHAPLVDHGQQEVHGLRQGAPLLAVLVPGRRKEHFYITLRMKAFLMEGGERRQRCPLPVCLPHNLGPRSGE